jgi:signal transduction histidine kinase/ligand-binding sensor domain-containing protein/DNA-binding response OmpR family regulator
MYKPYLLLFFLTLIGLNPNKAQTDLSVQSGFNLAPTLIFERYTSQNGLPDDRIRALHQDEKGFLWIGTMNGLSRYDGYAFKNFYKKEKEQGLAGNWSHAIAEDKSQSLWVGTIDGLTHFDYNKQTFTQYKHKPNDLNSLPTNRISSLLFDNFGKLWIGTQKGLVSLDTKTNTFKSYAQASLNAPIGCLAPSHDDCIWVATNDGVVRLDTRTETAQLYPLSIKANAYGNRFWALLEKDKNLYIGTGNSGLVRLNYDIATQNYGRFDFLNTYQNSSETLNETEIFSICPAENGDFWLGTNRGLACIQQTSAGQNLRFYHHNAANPHSLSNDHVYKVFIDQTHVLWCGTEVGLNKLDLNTTAFQYFAFANPSANDFVRSIAAPDAATVWLGTAQSGFYRYDARNGTTTRFKFSPRVFNEHRALDVDKTTGHVWMGSLGGLQKTAATGGATETLINDKAVFALHRDKAGNRWVGTNRGLFKIEGNAPPKLFIINGLSENVFVRSIHEDAAGRLWIGADTEGVGFVDTNGKFTRLTPQNAGLLGNTIYAIAEYPTNTVWIGSELGLNKVNIKTETDGKTTYTTQYFGQENGLPAQSVNSILTDNQGSLWLGTIKGLVRFNVEAGIFQYYLSQLSFNHSCAFRLNDHSFLFGANDGFVQFDPFAIATNAQVPKVALSNFRLFNQEVVIGATYNDDVILNQGISATKSLTINYLNNAFTIEFTALHFSDPQQNRYAYQLEGYDKTWILTNGDNRSATYTNLDAGNYTFKVKASNHTGQWNDTPIVLKVTILPPPWKTWWAIMGYFLLFNALLYIFVRYLLRESKQRQQILFEQKEKEQLRAVNDLKQQFFTDISHEFRTPLSLITGPVEELIGSSEVIGDARKKVKLIQRNSQKLLHLIDELMTFQKLEQGVLTINPVSMDIVAFMREVFNSFEPLALQKGIHFTFKSSEKKLDIAADADKLEKIFNNLILNAFRFTSKGGRIDINLLNTEGSLKITIEDTGKGITVEEMPKLFTRFFQSKDNPTGGTGIGLSLAKSLVELHNGSIEVTSEPNVNTCFTVFLPIENSLIAENKAIENTENWASERIENVENTQDTPEKPIYTEGSLPSIETVNAPTLLSKIADTPPTETDWHNRKTDLPNLLIVEDNLEMQDFLLSLFQDNYRVHRANNGREALAFIKKIEPDAVISDVMMPEMDGITLCKRLKTDINTSHIPLILLTAKTTVENTIEGLGMGADDYIPKPFHPDLLRLRVKKLIETRRILIEKYNTGQKIIPKDVTRNPLDEAFLQKTLDAINAHLNDEEFSVEELSKCVNMSRSNLFRKLKALTGQTPIEFIYHIRLKHAAGLVLERKLSVSEIAYQVGFQTPSAFSKSFKKQFGKTPTEYLTAYLQG